ncbi:hypothetical protein BDR04DRAFT_1099254 [Suillus decipiens]|nr:hypothetical protein BDR04DRAFT_1099254 [Suillus decipiens]
MFKLLQPKFNFHYDVHLQLPRALFCSYYVPYDIFFSTAHYYFKSLIQLLPVHPRFWYYITCAHHVLSPSLMSILVHVIRSFAPLLGVLDMRHGLRHASFMTCQANYGTLYPSWPT